MRTFLMTAAGLGLVLLTGCAAADDDPDELETVPEAPTRPPVEHDAPQLDEDPLEPDADSRDTLPEPEDDPD